VVKDKNVAHIFFYKPDFLNFLIPIKKPDFLKIFDFTITKPPYSDPP